MSHQQLFRLLVDKAQLALNDGAIFGEEGLNHFRINVACPRVTLEKAMEQLKLTFRSQSCISAR